MGHKYYFSEGLNKQVLELSDNHLWWDINNANVRDKEIADETVGRLCYTFAAIFKAHYHTQVYFCGRSGRHVCVEDTPANRRNYQYMCNTVKMMQRLIVFFVTKNEDYFTQYITKRLPKWLETKCKIANLCIVSNKTE